MEEDYYKKLEEIKEGQMTSGKLSNDSGENKDLPASPLSTKTKITAWWTRMIGLLLIIGSVLFNYYILGGKTKVLINIVHNIFFGHRFGQAEWHCKVSWGTCYLVELIYGFAGTFIGIFLLISSSYILRKRE